MSNQIIVYKLDPIDHWGGWMTADEALSISRSSDFSICRANFQAQYNKTVEGAMYLGWTGDEEQVFITGLPDPSLTSFMIAIKQEQGGVTFVSTREPLFHLQDQGFPYLICTKDGEWIGRGMGH